MLSYRAVVWQWTVGVAPKWADALLILAAGIACFVAMSATIAFAWLLSEREWISAVIVGVVGAFAWIFVWLMWYWSMHFRHRAPVSVDAPADEEELPLAKVAPPLAEATNAGREVHNGTS